MNRTHSVRARVFRKIIDLGFARYPRNVDKSGNVWDTNIEEEANLRLNVENLGGIECSSNGENNAVVFLCRSRKRENVREDRKPNFLWI